MSLKAEIETWVAALASYDNNEFEEALGVFDNIAETSKILFNMGVIHATLGEHEKAVDCYQRAIKLDQYLAVAYFQQGVSNFLVGDFEEALANFNDTLLYLRGNTYIDYEQLGLKFRLYSCEVLFNRGLCYIYLQQEAAGLQDFNFAVKEKVTPDHDVIDEAIREKAEGYTVFSIPVGVVYRPNEAKVKNLKTKDYLGKAKLVAASDRANAFTGFQGSELKKLATGDVKDDRPQENISYAATNLVKADLQSRARQQSEPPINRNMFPPTPPPENDKGSMSNGGARGGPGMTGRAASVKNPPMRPLARTTTTPASMEDPYDNPRMRGQGRSPDMNFRTPAMTPNSMDDYDTRMRGQGRSPDMGMMGPSRMGTMRGYSESRPPPARQMTRRDMGGRDRDMGGRDRDMGRNMSRQRDMGGRGGYQDDGYDDVYDMYTSPRSSQGMRRRPTRMEAQYPDDDDDYASDAYDDEFAEEGDFEMMGPGQGIPAPLRTRRPSTSRGGRGGGGRQMEIRKVRIKVHADNDTRYIMVGPAVEYGDFEGRIREKFGIKTRLKLKMMDDGDMITMADQDDLDMLIQSAKSVARREGSDMAKMEIWIQEMGR